MYCDNYCPELIPQPGTQPIRVLAQYYSNIFINIRNELSQEYPLCKKVTCNFKTDNEKAESPFVIYNRITIPYTFLSFLWCSSYQFLNSIPHDGVGPHYPSIFSLREYGISLLRKYSEWNKTQLPNPEYYHKDIHEYVGKANFVFLIGVNYIFYHEFAHVALKHSTDVSPERLKEIETEADLFAVRRILNLKNEDGTEYDEATRLSVFSGLITAFATLTMTTATMNGFDHPDPDTRLLTCLESLTIDENDEMWMIAGWYLLQWQVQYRKHQLDIPPTLVSRKESFMTVYSKFQDWKAQI